MIGARLTIPGQRDITVTSKRITGGINRAENRFQSTIESLLVFQKFLKERNGNKVDLYFSRETEWNFRIEIFFMT